MTTGRESAENDENRARPGCRRSGSRQPHHHGRGLRRVGQGRHADDEREQQQRAGRRRIGRREWRRRHDYGRLSPQRRRGILALRPCV